MSVRAAEPVEPIVGRRSDLTTRVVSGAVLGPLVLAAAWSSSVVWWTGLVTIACLLALREAYSIVRAGGRAPTDWLGYALVPVLVLALVPEGLRLLGAESAAPLVYLALAAAVIAGYAVQMRRPPEARAFEDWALTIALALHAGVLGGFAAGLHVLDSGRFWTLFYLALLWTNDTAAFAGGRTFGKTPMAPRLSPKKTMEGLYSATLATIALGAITPSLTRAFGYEAPAGAASLAVVGLAVACVGPLGDLSVSLLKRQAGVKESGHLIPGHGGILDRTDSLLFAAPAIYVAARVLGG